MVATVIIVGAVIASVALFGQLFILWSELDLWKHFTTDSASNSANNANPGSPAHHQRAKHNSLRLIKTKLFCLVIALPASAIAIAVVTSTDETTCNWTTRVGASFYILFIASYSVFCHQKS